MESTVSLKHTLPHVDYISLETEGLALWVMGASDDDSIMPQLVEDYGGVLVEKKSSYQLWFFFSTNACLVAARLRSWSRFLQSGVYAQLFGATLRVGQDGHKALSIGESIRNQEVVLPDKAEIWVHPNAFERVKGVLGISLNKGTLAQGMSDEDWLLLEADSRLPYQPTMGWYGIIRGIGDSSERAFQLGWREFYPHFEAIFQRNKIRYNHNNYFLMFLIEGVRQFRSLTKELFDMALKVKESKPDDYWPCSAVFVDRKGFSFNDDLPLNVGVDWQRLTPEFPHMSKRSALILGSDFSFHTDRFSPTNNSADDWCSVSYNSDHDLGDANLLPNLIPSLVLGEHPYCFYCGHRSHDSCDCPTRHMAEKDADVWRQISFLDIDAMREGADIIETFDLSEGSEEFWKLLKEPTAAGYLLRGSFEIGWPGQLRSVPFFWTTRDKNLGEAFKKDESPSKRELNSPAWAYLETFAEKMPEQRENELKLMAANTMRDFRVSCLRGFSAMELGEYERAINFWHEAEVNSPYPVVAAWHIFLQARAYECLRNFPKAIELYEQVIRSCPRWTFALYRKCVCYVKHGFTSQILNDIVTIVQRDGNYFNKILLDSELDRGHIHIFSCLVGLWRNAEERSTGEDVKLRGLAKEVHAWFPKELPYAQNMIDRINSLLQMGKIANYVTLQVVGGGRLELEKDLQDFVNNEASRLKKLFQDYSIKLQEIRNEAAWFPFPRFLKEFNTVFNRPATNANWVFKGNLGQPDSFRKAQKLTEEVQEDVDFLHGRMRNLLMIRDATLFVLILVETFFWLEVVGFVLIFAILPLIEIYGAGFGMGWTAEFLAGQRGEVQKALFFVISVCAMGIAGMRTVLRFEKIRAKVLDKARTAPTKKKKASPKKSKAKKK